MTDTNIASRPFVDLYGGVAANYVTRPHYPEQLFHWLAEQSPDNALAWDCACGSGQASHDLAKYFQRVIATDASPAQIKLTKPAPGIIFKYAAAEVSGLQTNSVDLINVGMAAHWFDLPAFYEEARRVAKPGAVLSLLVYGEPELADERLNQQVQDFIGRMNIYGPPERHFVETLYKDIPFPFSEELQMPPMNMEADMTFPQLMKYFRSRSTVINCTQQEGRDPVAVLESVLHDLLEIPDEPLHVKWPLRGRVARIG